MLKTASEIPINKQIAIIKKLNDHIIIQEAARRRQKLREEQGPYATLKKMTPCPFCGEEFSVRGLRDHLPRCPEREKSRESRERKTGLNLQKLAKIRDLYGKYGDKMIHPAAQKLGVDVETIRSAIQSLNKEPLEKIASSL